MKSSASRISPPASPQRQATRMRVRPTSQMAAVDVPASPTPTPRPGTRNDERTLSSNLPDQLPVLREECDLVRIYFADLIATVLKDTL